MNSLYCNGNGSYTSPGNGIVVAFSSAYTDTSSGNASASSSTAEVIDIKTVVLGRGAISVCGVFKVKTGDVISVATNGYNGKSENVTNSNYFVFIPI